MLTSSSAEGSTLTMLMSEIRYSSNIVCTGMMLLILSAIRLRSNKMWRLQGRERRCLSHKLLN